jgi:branched-subunit amino acid aminotransferase/4-amino-4-deoxychorismate lyase
MMELDGTPVTPAELSALALYNYGHFTSMTVERGRVRGLGLHLDRLVGDCKTVFGADLDPDRVRHLVRQALGDESAPAVVVRVTVFDPALGLGHPGGTTNPRILVTGRAAVGSSLPPLRLQSCRYDRDLPSVKHTGLFGTVYHRRMAQTAGFDDVLFVNAQAQITEGATWNVAFIADGEIIWPDGECLAGVTMRLLRGATQDLEIPSRTAPVVLADITGQTAAFITNAAIGLRPVRDIDGRPLADASEIVETLRRAYDTIEGEPL